MSSFFEKLSSITTFIFDVDGVLTDGIVHVTENGDQLRQFNIKDGYALKLAIKRGFLVAVISGATSKSTEFRLRALGVKDIFLGVDSKIHVYQDFVQANQLSAEQILYMGDDIPDFPVMKLAGLATCPADAVEEIKAISHYISPRNGGKACARDVIEKTLKAQNKWYNANPSAYDGRLM
ncbi:MAG: HAD-IIIA family hydrolase [Sphingobacteriaceae bacterium]|jgi:3-deoxy-D-manno-octulosonate 8-phosphate phosphatase (KDO 8-P phosphatase)|nr:MAG: HAD-IIIA family hydrolase [Pedobacter sp.]